MAQFPQLGYWLLAFILLKNAFFQPAEHEDYDSETPAKQFVDAHIVHRARERDSHEGENLTFRRHKRLSDQSIAKWVLLSRSIAFLHFAIG